MVQRQERETIRLLLNYADKQLEDQVLGVLLLNELDDVEFSSPVYKEIFDAFVEAQGKDEHIDTSHFLSGKSEEVKKVVTDLMVSKYGVSPHWSDKYGIYFPKDDEDLDKKVISNVMHLKFRMIQLWAERNKELLKEANSESEIDQLLDKQIVLKNADKELSEKLGIVSGKY